MSDGNSISLRNMDPPVIYDDLAELAEDDAYRLHSKRIDPTSRSTGGDTRTVGGDVTAMFSGEHQNATINGRGLNLEEFKRVVELLNGLSFKKN